MHRITVLGGGMVGGVMAAELARDAGNNVTVVDRSREALARLKAGAPVDTLQADLSNNNDVLDAVKGSDVVVGAVPGWLGLRVLGTVVGEGINIVDISFMPEDPRSLNQTARDKEVTAIVDCGVAPGLSNMLLGRMKQEFQELHEVRIYVGGLPTVRALPYEYKAVFSPIDVLEEYTRPARYMRDGKMVTMPALSEVEHLEIPGVGTLEAFNTDGLRTLLDTIPCPNMVEKTLRYPGHAMRMQLLRDTGFLSVEPVDVGGTSVKPLDVSAHMLQSCWKLDNGEEEFTVLRVMARGIRDGKNEVHTYDMLDKTDHAGTTSMARTTGFPAAITAKLVASGEYAKRGVFPPEIMVEDENIFKKIIGKLADRGILFKHNVQTIS